MTKYEYKSVTVEQQRLGLFKSREIPELDSILNREGRDGWRFHDVIVPSGAFGESDRAIIVFERELA